MVSKGIKGARATLGYAATGAGPFTAVAEVVRITPPKIAVKDVELTHLESLYDHEEWTPGTQADSDPVCVLNYAKAQADTLKDLAGVARWWQIGYPDGSTEVFPGYLHGFGVEQIGRDEAIRCEASMKVSGAMTFTPFAFAGLTATGVTVPALAGAWTRAEVDVNGEPAYELVAADAVLSYDDVLDVWGIAIDGSEAEWTGPTRSGGPTTPEGVYTPNEHGTGNLTVAGTP